MTKMVRFIILIRDLCFGFFTAWFYSFQYVQFVESRQQVHLPDLQIHL